MHTPHAPEGLAKLVKCYPATAVYLALVVTVDVLISLALLWRT